MIKIKPVIAAAAVLAGFPVSVAPAHAASDQHGVDADLTAPSGADATTVPAVQENQVSDPATIPWVVVTNSFSSS